MKDFIFIIGASGIGKTMLAKKLLEHYKGALAEMNTVPEFEIPAGIDDPGIFEEKVCWECCVAQLKKFHEFGINNVISGDFDDLRTADIPIEFQGYNYVTLKLICNNFEQNLEQMKNRGNGLIDFDLLSKSSEKINARPLLINEVEIDVTGKDSDAVFDEAVKCIDSFNPLIEYEYVKPSKELFYSWVISNGLR